MRWSGIRSQLHWLSVLNSSWLYFSTDVCMVWHRRTLLTVSFVWWPMSSPGGDCGQRRRTNWSSRRCVFLRLETVRSMWPQHAHGTLSHYTLRQLRHCPFSSANSRPLCSLEVILTVLHVLNICTFYYDSRRYFSYIVRCPSSHYWLYASLISSSMMMMIIMMSFLKLRRTLWMVSPGATRPPPAPWWRHCYDGGIEVWIFKIKSLFSESIIIIMW